MLILLYIGLRVIYADDGKQYAADDSPEYSQGYVQPMNRFPSRPARDT